MGDYLQLEFLINDSCKVCNLTLINVLVTPQMFFIRYLLFFLVLLSLDGKSQEKSVVFSDRFDNNMHRWIVDSSATHVAKIANGKYLLLHMVKENNWWLTKRVVVDPKKDFDIEIMMQSFYYQDEGFGGLIWGEENQRFFEFSIAPSGHFRILEHTSTDQIRAWKEKTFSSIIHQGIKQRNKLRIEWKQDSYRFFINDSIVFRKVSQRKQGPGIGFLVEGQHGVAFDNFRLAVEDVNKQEPKLPKDPHYVFQDNFTQNDNGWGINAWAKIELGAYNIHNDKDSTFFSNMEISIDSNREFQIEALFRNIEHTKTLGYGLSWSDRSNDSEFIISPDGYFKVERFNGKKYKTVKKWARTTALKIGAHLLNKLTVNYKPPMCSYYINNELVFTEKILSGAIEEIGFVVTEGQKIAVDYLTVISERRDDLQAKIHSLQKELIHEKEFRESDHRLVEVISEEDDDNTLDFAAMLNDDDETEEPDIDYLSWFIYSDNLVGDKTLLYSYQQDNFLVENKTDEALIVESYLRTRPDNCLIELQYAASVGAESSAHAFFIANEMDDQYYSFVTDKGFIAVNYSNDESESKLIDWKGCGQLNQNNGAMNKFSVLILQGRWYYYVNDNLVYEGLVMPFIPAAVSFHVSKQQKMELDFVRVYSLK